MARTILTRMVWLAMLAFVLAPDPARAACKLELISSVDVQLGGAGAVLLPVKINGHDTWMVLQMSSGISLVNRKVAEQLGMEFQEQRKFQSNQGNGRYFPQMSIVTDVHRGQHAGWCHQFRGMEPVRAATVRPAAADVPRPSGAGAAVLADRAGRRHGA